MHQEMQRGHTLGLPGKELTTAFSSSVFFSSVAAGTFDVAEIWSSWTFKNPRHKPSDSSVLDYVPTPCCPWEGELLVPAFVVGERPNSYQHLQSEGFSEKGRESDVDHQNNNKYRPHHRTAPSNPSVTLLLTSLFPQQMLFPLLGSLSCLSSGGALWPPGPLLE